MILKIYESILRFAGLTTDDDGFIKVKLNDKKSEYISVDGSNLVLPTKNQLESIMNNDKIIFHPLCENVLRGETPVLKKYRQALNIKLNYVTGIIIQTILKIALDTSIHKDLESGQNNILTLFKECDAKTLSNFVSLLHNKKVKPDRLFVNIYLKKGGVYKTKKYSVASIISFPFYEDIDNLNIRKKDKEIYKRILEYMFLNIDIKEEYNYGSTSRIAPLTDSLLTGALGLASRLNDQLSLFKDHISNFEVLMFDDNWVEHFKDLEAIRNEIGKIPSHIDSSSGNVKGQIETQDYPSLGGSTSPVRTPNPVAINQPITAVHNQPAGYQGYPGYQPAPELVRTKNGLDFRSINIPNNQANTQVYQPQMNQYNQGYMPQQNNMSLPSWAGQQHQQRSSW